MLLEPFTPQQWDKKNSELQVFLERDLSLPSPTDALSNADHFSNELGKSARIGAAAERSSSRWSFQTFLTFHKCLQKWSSNKNNYLYCIPRPPAAAQTNKEKPSTCLPICLRPPPSPRAANILEGKRKVRTTKNHENRHLCR